MVEQPPLHGQRSNHQESDNQANTLAAAANSSYVDECRQTALAELVLDQMARQITTWLLIDEKAASSMTLVKLAQLSGFD